MEKQNENWPCIPKLAINILGGSKRFGNMCVCVEGGGGGVGGM